MNPTAPRPYRGVFPVAPTIFDDRGELDLDGQRRCIDFMIDAGSNGICILANFSEQFVLTDAEREQVMDAVLRHVGGRVPVIVTTTHFSSRVCAECFFFSSRRRHTIFDCDWSSDVCSSD